MSLAPNLCVPAASAGQGWWQRARHGAIWVTPSVPPSPAGSVPAARRCQGHGEPDTGTHIPSVSSSFLPWHLPWPRRCPAAFSAALGSTRGPAPDRHRSALPGASPAPPVPRSFSGSPTAWPAPSAPVPGTVPLPKQKIGLFFSPADVRTKFGTFHKQYCPVVTEIDKKNEVGA